ncbi:hypothetical protein SY28_13220, partial [Meiothermus taiwanensis]
MTTTAQTAQHGEKPLCWAFAVDWGAAALKGETRQRRQKRFATTCSNYIPCLPHHTPTIKP